MGSHDNNGASRADKSDDGGGDDIMLEERESCIDVKGVDYESEPPSSVLGCSADDTVPEEQYNFLSTKETGHTKESSTFINVDKKGRKDYERGEVVLQDASVVDPLFNLDGNWGKVPALGEEDGQSLHDSLNEEGMIMSKDLEAGRYPKRKRTQKTNNEDTEEEAEEQVVRDPYDFQDDSFNDEDYEPPQKDLPTVYSPSQPVVEIPSAKKRKTQSNKIPFAKETVTMRTPPETFKSRRDPQVEACWRQAGGHTPDRSDGKNMKYGSFDPNLLRMLVHLLAKSKKIDLSKEPLKPPFFKDLVKMYGDLPNTNSAKLAPYTSWAYVQRKWRELFCTKRDTKTGSQHDVHKFEYPQQSSIPCRLCSEQPHDQTPDPRDSMLLRLTDQLNQDQGRKEEEESSGLSVEKSKANNVKQPCHHCNKHVSNLRRHLKESCRSNPDNLVECPRCTMMILKTCLTEHLNGRMDKKTGAVINRPCQGIDEDKKAKCDLCGILVRNLRRHKRELHIMKRGHSGQSCSAKKPAQSAADENNKDAKKQKQGEAPLPPTGDVNTGGRGAKAVKENFQSGTRGMERTIGDMRTKNCSDHAGKYLSTNHQHHRHTHQYHLHLSQVLRQGRSKQPGRVCNFLQQGWREDWLILMTSNLNEIRQERRQRVGRKHLNALLRRR